MNTPSDLNEALQNKKLVLFIGSGFSRNAGLPTWATLTKNMLNDNRDKIPSADIFIQNLNAEIMSPLEVLEKLKKQHRKTIYESFEKELGKNLDSNIHKKISRITRKIVTTNYDKLIELNSKNLEVIDNSSNYNLSKIDEKEDFILKIHGDISRMDSCIIFEDDYEKLYSGDTLASYQLGKIFSSHCCLFIGFSFTDPYIETLFNKISSLYSGFGPSHYLLTTNNTVFEGINNIHIESHDEIENFIDALISTTQSLKMEKPPQEIITSTANETFVDLQLKSEGTDTPPQIEYWTGRESELKTLSMDSNFKVIFITGIGGQGKSSLAAYYSEQCRENNLYKLTDWRDFKEQEHNFDIKIINIIEKLSENTVSAQELIGLDTDSLIHTYFKFLSGKACLFVFDNIDSYIDLEKFEPTGSIGKLVSIALKNHHNSKFIFTCRPFIHFAGVDFFQLRLSGLTKENVLSLFTSAKLPISVELASSLASRAHKLTDGHALWVSLILAQAKRGARQVEDFLDKIERKQLIDSSESSILSERILREIWDSLNDKQKILLRTLAEAVTSETEDEISKIVSSELNYNQFSKSLRTLKDLHLIVVKGKENYIELHPLVKEFIKTNFPSQEQYKYISLFINHYDRIIILLKPKLKQILGISEFKSWSNKIELHINSKELNEAIAAMLEIHDSIIRSGYTEEFVRLACTLLEKITWKKGQVDSLNNFLKFFDQAITAITEYGDKDSAIHYLEKFESIIIGKTNEYILLLSAKTHLHWYNEAYPEAIRYGEEAEYFISQSGDSEKWCAKHRLNLAYRDSKLPEKLEKSLNFFLNNHDINELCSDKTFNKEIIYTTYGNVGRSLHHQKKYEQALNCFTKSIILMTGHDTADVHLNKGYALSWIGESLKDSNSEEYIYFFLSAHQNWKNCAPPLANKIEQKINSISKSVKLTSIQSLENWQIEKHCNDWCKKRIPH